MNTERELLKRALNYIAYRPKNESFNQLCHDIEQVLLNDEAQKKAQNPQDTRTLMQRSLNALEKADAIYGTGFISLRVDLAKALKQPETECKQVGVLKSYCHGNGYKMLPNIEWTNGEYPQEGAVLYSK